MRCKEHSVKPEALIRLLLFSGQLFISGKKINLQ